MTCILEKWTHSAAESSREIIFPDGCRDLIVIRQSGGIGFCFISDLQTAPQYANIAQGAEMTGFRLKPCVRIDEARLIERVLERDCEPAQIGSLVDEHCHLPDGLDEAVQCLSQEATSVAQAASTLGISQRSMQRLFRAQGLHPPEFWLLLARARRAASRMAPQDSLADIAVSSGYSDQAHMTREFRRWFGLSPASLRRQTRLHHLLCQSGLGNPATGEQISIR